MEMILLISILLNAVMILLIVILFLEKKIYKNKKQLEIQNLTNENINLIENILTIINGE
jgi:hypothetical protein